MINEKYNKIEKLISEKIMTTRGIFCLCFFIHVCMIPFKGLPCIPDEVNPLAWGFIARGCDWQQYLITDGYYYKYGQLLLFYPIIYFFREPKLLYTILLVVYALVSSTIPLIVYKLLQRHFNVTDTKTIAGISLLVGLLPAITLNTKFIWAEPLMTAVAWYIIYALCNVCECDGKRKQFCYSVLLAGLQMYAYMLHTRGIIIAIACCMCVLYLYFIRKNRKIRLFPYMGISTLLYIMDRNIVRMQKNILYGSSEELIGASSFIDASWMSDFFSKDGFFTWIETMGSWCYVSVISTFGLSAVGMVFVIKAFWGRKIKTNEQTKVFMLFGGLLFVGSLLSGTLFFFDDIYLYLGKAMEFRGDKYVYIRYIDTANICLSFWGLYALMCKKDFFVRECKWYVIFAIMLVGSFIFIIVPKIDNTITWGNNTIQFNYLCDIGACSRGGFYEKIPFFAQGIALFGFFSFIVLVIAIHTKNKKHLVLIYFSVFVICYILNSYNVAGRMGRYTENFVRAYEEIIRTVNGKDEFTNIYLDDEILRCGMKYYYNDYQIMTARDNELEDNMFIISTNQNYNEQLYEDDYYMICEENVLDGYHMYIKGHELNKYITECGYSTKQIFLE